ncbi:acyl carrier protein [Virgisporangium aurantiacum]|uniref:Carrier domain-containing protein n=1 Tax=Virgisporangium aurantiacum TaxID=175570 RepID=A0A8J4E5C8_9ACTN|nr:acyl carrier protein [Virgisporangium aurantiacum]GIJ62141.1 hypothetical protein Vau01_096570 [Virgisporangium aurantiacum]
MNTVDATRANAESSLEQLVREIGRIPATDTTFGPHSELFDSGYIDSLGIVALTTYIEQQFGVAFTEEQLFDPRFVTVAGIAQIVATGAPSGPHRNRRE